MDENWKGIISQEYFGVAKEACDLVLAEYIRPNCVALVDAFGFPDHILTSSIGRYDGNIYEALFVNAKASSLNAKDPFEGYYEYLRPHLDLDFLKKHN